MNMKTVFTWRVLRYVVIAVLSVGLLHGGYRYWVAPKGHGPGFNVLLITLDTTRADHIGCYGNRGASTPNIDRLAKEGVLFFQCSAHIPITLPSHASMMTGLVPFAHGVRDNGRYRLHDSNQTLAEILKAHGYATCAQVAAFVLNSQFGLSQGFDTYEDVQIPSRAALEKEARDAGIEPDVLLTEYAERPAEDIADKAITWLRENAERKFFLWTHFFDPHQPYRAPERFTEMFPNNPYLAEIAYADEQVGRVLDELDRLGITENTLVILTADHGEGKGQHKEDTHSFYVYDTTLWVPMIIRCPGSLPSAGATPAQVRSIDITPTVLDFLDLPPEEDAQGQSLIPLFTGKTSDLQLEAYGESIVSMLDFGYAPLHCLRAGGWKYIHADPPELYHVAKDPYELVNLAPDKPEKTEEMAEWLSSYIEDAPDLPWASGSDVEMDPETVARLKALGYVGGLSAEIDRKAATQLPATALEELDFAGANPMEKWEQVRCVCVGQGAMRAEKYDMAEEIFLRLLELEPESLYGLHLLARCYVAQEKTDPAIEQIKKVLDQQPDDVRSRLVLGVCLGIKEQYTEAAAEFRRVIELQPYNVWAWYCLAMAMGKAEEWDRSIEAFTQALSVEPNFIDARLRLGECYFFLGRYDESLEMSTSVIALNHEVAAAHLQKGLCYERKAMWEQARESYARTLELNDQAAMAHSGLAAYHLSQGQFAEAIREAQAAIGLDEEAVVARTNLGLAYIRSSQLDAAREQLETAVEIDPNLAEGWYNLACAEALAGREGRARECLQRAFRLGGERLIVHARNDPDLASLPPQVLREAASQTDTRPATTLPQRAQANPSR